ncbi:MAG: hypothetical protein ABSC06_02955 [Rhodopila sp.]|jgi:hypothetical protein
MIFLVGCLWLDMQYFLHLPKTAGTSLLAHVRANLPPERLFTVYHGITRQDFKYYRHLVRPETLLFGHFSFGFHELWHDAVPRYATVLRHPVDRVVSFYRYCLWRPEHPMHPIIVNRGLTLEDFVTARITPETNNLIVRALAASYQPLAVLQDRLCDLLAQAATQHPVRRCPANRLPTALNNLKYFNHVGSIEKLDETLDFLLLELGCGPPMTSLTRENVTGDGTTEISEGTRRLIESENELDMELYLRCS